MSRIGSVNGRLLGGMGGLSCPSLYFVLAHLPRERVAVHTQRAGGLGQAALGFAEDAGDEALLELADGIVELDAFVHHLLDEPIEPVRDHSSSRPVRRPNASTYLSRVFATSS